jgi:FkbM family methyltransferase
MLNQLNYLSRPEYLFHPRQVFRRFKRIANARPELLDVKLPWGAVVNVHTGENIGSGIYYYGIYDKIVPEAIWRLLDRGETAVEIGANIGQNCSAMAARAGPDGHVIAYEPHPEIFGELKRNYERWPRAGFAPIQFENAALGDTTGETTLVQPEEFATNRGAAALRHNATTEQGIKVRVRRLDDCLDGIERIGVCKIDVEGHELAVLHGAEQTLRKRGIRDIIFEDFNTKPSPVTEFLKEHGFTVFELSEGWLKPRLIHLRAAATAAPGFTFNYLATLDPARARVRFRIPGWRCLLCL